MNVQIMCIRAKQIIARLVFFLKKRTPIKTSQNASIIYPTCVGIRPIVIKSIVSFASISAGLVFGKNFKTPNHKYTNPILHKSHL